MSGPVGQREDEYLLVEKCLTGDSQALDRLRQDYLELLRHALQNKGATTSQADELIGDLWTDCVVGRSDRRPLLEKFNGRASLKNWLFRVGINALIDRLRRQQKQTDLTPSPTANEPGHDTDVFDRFSSPDRRPVESSLVTLIRACLEQAFQQCSAPGLLMLRLVYLHDLSQRELAAMWGCHEATISRTLTGAMESIAQHTLAEAHRIDPRLKLNWDDILELSQTEGIDFI